MREFESTLFDDVVIEEDNNMVLYENLSEEMTQIIESVESEMKIEFLEECDETFRRAA